MKEIRYEGKEGFGTGGIHERRDSVSGGIQESGRKGFREKGIQERREKDRRVQDSMHAEQEGCRKGSVVISIMARNRMFSLYIV